MVAGSRGRRGEYLLTGAVLGVLLGLVVGIWATMLQELLFRSFAVNDLYVGFFLFTIVLGIMVVLFWYAIQVFREMEKAPSQG